MITRIEATRYRCFEKLDAELGVFRVIVGANGSGKTTLLDIPVLLGDLLKVRTIDEAFMSAHDDRTPRARSLNELLFQDRREDFILSVEAKLPEHLTRDLGGASLDNTTPSLRQLLAQDGRWPEGVAKPPAPKEVIQALIRSNRASPLMVIYSQIVRAVSTAGCVDPAFHHVRDALRAWFPAEGA